MPSSKKDAEWPVTFEAVEKAQLMDILKKTTPLQRFQWLEQTLELLAPLILENQKRLPKKYF